LEIEINSQPLFFYIKKVGKFLFYEQLFLRFTRGNFRKEYSVEFLVNQEGFHN